MQASTTLPSAATVTANAIATAAVDNIADIVADTARVPSSLARALLSSAGAIGIDLGRAMCLGFDLHAIANHGVCIALGISIGYAPVNHRNGCALVVGCTVGICLSVGCTVTLGIAASTMPLSATDGHIIGCALVGLGMFGACASSNDDGT